MTFRLIHADCIAAMQAMDENSVDAIVTDPPYQLSFMGKTWDRNLNHGLWATEALRVLKPGAHLLAFGGTRTYHRLACAIEDAGFEIRDCLAWLYGSGFPKSLNVGNGFGTALKPAHEPIVLARKPLSERNVAANVQRWGTGALNIDGCRIEFQGDAGEAESKGKNRHADFGSGPRDNAVFGEDKRDRGADGNYDASGRWPPNVTMDTEAAAMLDAQTGESTSRIGRPRAGRNGDGWGMTATGAEYGDTGGASRFLYVSKADREERNRGVEHLSRKALNWSSGEQSPGTFQAEGTLREAANHHPTVKPVALMSWLCRMVTPPKGTILDPFTGSGSTGMAALREGFEFIGIEREAEYVEIARARIIGDAPLFNVEADPVTVTPGDET